MGVKGEVGGIKWKWTPPISYYLPGGPWQTAGGPETHPDLVMWGNDHRLVTGRGFKARVCSNFSQGIHSPMAWLVVSWRSRSPPRRALRVVRRRATPSASPAPPVRLVAETGTCEPLPAAVRKMFALAAMVSRSWFCRALVPYTSIRVNPNFDQPLFPSFLLSSLSTNPFTHAWRELGRVKKIPPSRDGICFLVGRFETPYLHSHTKISCM